MKKLILHLGGGINRADKCISLSKEFPDAPILVSSENKSVLKYYKDKGMDLSRVFIDDLAWDTVTNFTETYKRIKNEFKANEVYVVTHDFHIKRSMAIANAVYWGRGIKPIACPCPGPDIKESDKLITDDEIRAWTWRFTGILFYTKKIREQRVGVDYSSKWNEIGL